MGSVDAGASVGTYAGAATRTAGVLCVGETARFRSHVNTPLSTYVRDTNRLCLPPTWCARAPAAIAGPPPWLTHQPSPQWPCPPPR